MNRRAAERPDDDPDEELLERADAERDRTHYVGDSCPGGHRDEQEIPC